MAGEGCRRVAEELKALGRTVWAEELARHSKARCA